MAAAAAAVPPPQHAGGAAPNASLLSELQRGRNMLHASQPHEEPAARRPSGGGMADALEQIRAGGVALRHVEQQPGVPARQPSDSIAEILKRKIAHRKALLTMRDEEEGGGSEWD